MNRAIYQPLTDHEYASSFVLLPLGGWSRRGRSVELKEMQDRRRGVARPLPGDVLDAFELWTISKRDD